MTKYNLQTLLCLFFFIFTATVGATPKKITSASGLVKDASTGELMPFVTIIFENSPYGSVTNDDGEFSVQNTEGYNLLKFSFVGYDTKTVRLEPGVKNAGLEILLTPTILELDEVVIKPKRQRYSRKNNPAVDLIRKVIDHKDDNRIDSKDEYKVEYYEKLNMALDNFDAESDKNVLQRKFPFLKNHIDTSAIDGNPILTLSIREKLADKYYRKSPKSEKTVVKAMRHEGIDKKMDNYGALSSNIEEIMQEVNIFDNNINFLLNRFVSPLSSTLATRYYQYFIMDTVVVNGDKCIDLAFVPVNSQSYGFTGRLYILTDGTYAIKKVTLNVPTHINLNFVKHLHIDQEFKQTPDGMWVMDKDNTYLQLHVIEGTQVIYAHQLRSYDHYQFEVPEGNEIYNKPGNIHFEEETKFDDFLWTHLRHIPLRESEGSVGEIMTQFELNGVFRFFMKTIEILTSGFIETSKEHDTNKIDIGPINTTVSFNDVEGLRLRAGALTTANLHPRLFAGGYAAYGFKDNKWKYMGKLTYSFDDKKYHENESPINNLSLSHEYDLYTPGQDFIHTSKDNMFVALKVGQKIDKMNYLRTSKLNYEKEWLTGVTLNTWVQQQNNEAAGALQYIMQDGAGNQTNLKSFTTAEWGASIRFAPGERRYNSRVGKGSAANLSKDAPIFILSHQIGTDALLGGDFSYHHTEFSVEKRIWLSSFGRLDTQFKAGKIWNKVPFPLLVMPNANQSFTIQQDAFHLLNAMELVADEYVSATINYHLNGLITNRIPYINRLGIREVAAISGFYGKLTDKNNPALSDDLFVLPQNTFAFQNKPYLEYSFGVENIFRILQVNYYRRLSYLHHPNISKHGIRIAVNFTF